VVHLNGYCHAARTWQAPTVVAAHSCVLSWWWAVHATEAPPSWSTYRDRVAAGLLAADRVVAPTAAMLAQLQRWYGVAHGSVIPNCRRPGWVRQCPKERLVLAVGRIWDEAKNLSVLGRIAAGVPWPIVVAGDGTHPAGGRREVPAVQALGPMPFPDLAEWLLRASVFVLPARYEPFGLAALEAGLAGCALVLGDIPSLREVWGDAATFVDPDDDRALLATLAAMTADRARCARLGARARERAQEFGCDRTADCYLAMYDALVSGRRDSLTPQGMR
jgi:glycosyltransferase involved in cell wall biosynthesis